MIVTCAVCGKEYDTDGIQLMKQKNATDIERIYYVAPCCGFEYTVAITDKETRALMERQLLLAQIHRKNPQERTRKKLEKLNKELRSKLNALNNVKTKAK
jgi:hypothetical protein